MEVEPCTSKCEDIELETTPVSRLGLCEVCASKDAKYTCPRCEVKTCSLKCNRIHKLEVECNGERDRTKFIPINKFTNLDLSSDYRLLEEISRVVELTKKASKQKYYLKKNSIKLQREALAQKITIKFLPNTFVRHKNNTTRYDYVSKMILWHIDWVFVNCENLKITDVKIPGSSRLSVVLEKYLVKQEDQDVQEKLQYYQAVGLPGIKILLKAEQKKGKKFYELDPSDTLTQCFRNKLIIEYPTIHVVLKDQANFYDVIDTDDEEEAEEIQNQIKSGQEVISKIIKRSDSDDSIYESLKNFLFISEYSDEEIKSEDEN